MVRGVRGLVCFRTGLIVASSAGSARVLPRPAPRWRSALAPRSARSWVLRGLDDGGRFPDERAADHVAEVGARRHHRVDRVLLLDPEVEDDGARGLAGGGDGV